MYLERKIKLNDNIYFVRVEQEFKKNNDGIYIIVIKNTEDNYFDGGDFSILIEKIEKSYTIEKRKAYSDNPYIGDILYLYDRIPFLAGIKDIYMNSDNIIYAEGYISKAEIEKFILENKITMHQNENFKLFDERTWFI